MLSLSRDAGWVLSDCSSLQRGRICLSPDVIVSGLSK